MARQIGVSPAEAEAAAKPDQFITLRQSLSDVWLGPPGKPGRLVGILHRTAEFLHGQKSIPAVPAESMYAHSIDSRFLVQAIG
ncbi:MAG: hypothetical protein ACREE5_06310, partial [Acetobacteraceae bacterium]